MQSTVVKVAVTEGQSVVAGDIICVLEAMKMEQPVTTALTGTVESLRINVGDVVEGGQVLASIAEA
jgi:acetyl-CoA/propionyl-CoA carboxylase biotin carboxyl carrier protein